MTPSEIFGQEKFLLAASPELLYAFFLLFSSILGTLTMCALATGWQMGWDGINLHLEHLATALMKEITVAWPSTTSHDQQCSHMQHFRIVGESMILFESISWGAALLTLTGKKICSKHHLSQQDEGWPDSKVGRLQRLAKTSGF